MSQNKFESRLVLEPIVSRYLLIYLFLVHLLALVALLQPLQLPFWLQFALVTFVVISLAGWSRHLWQEKQSPTRFIWRTDGRWDYQSRKGEYDNLALLPASFISRWLIILHLAGIDGRRFRVVLLPDSLSRQQWHLLWLRLKYGEYDNFDS